MKYTIELNKTHKQ